MKQKALLIGINDYAPVGNGGPDLRGCVNDVRDMAHTLNVLNIVPAVPGQMRIITNARATRAAILDGFKWLIKDAKKGNVLVFYYSGHGSQVVDLSGDEPDHRDETICPHDFATAGMITDDVFRALMRDLPEGVNLDVVLDSCHAGTATRALVDGEELPEEAEFTVRYVEPPLDWGYFIDAMPLLPVRRMFKEQNGEFARQIAIDPKMNHVLWAACRDNQTSTETRIDGAWRGVFTYCYCRALRRAGTTVTRRRLDSLTSADVRTLGYPQVPQLEGTRESILQEVFT